MNFRLMGKADWQRIRDYVAGLAWSRPVHDDNGKPVLDSEGKPVLKGIQYRVTIEEMGYTRSTAQNARYWALMTAISQQAPAHMGGEWHHPEVWHEYCAARFLGMESGPFGHGVRKSTRRLKVSEFGEYMAEVEAWAYTELEDFEFGYQEMAA